MFQDDILKQKAKTSSDDSTKKSSEDLGTDNSNGEKKTKTYGSMTHKSSSDPDNQSTSYDGKDTHIKTEHNLQGKSIIKTVDEYMNTLLNVKLIPKIKSIFKTNGGKFEQIDKETTNENADNPPASLISKLLEKGKSIVTKQNDEVIKSESTEPVITVDTNKIQSSEIEQNKDIVTQNDVEVKPSTNFDETKANDQTNTSPTRETSEIKINNQNEVERPDKSQQNDDTAVPEIKTINNDTGSESTNFNDLIADLQAFADKNPEKSIEESTISTKAKQDDIDTFLINEKNEINKKQSNISTPSILETEQTKLIDNIPTSSNGTVLEIGTIKQKNENDPLNKSQNSTVTSASEMLNKTKASELEFAGTNDQHEEKNKNVQVKLSGESNVSEKKIIDDDDESTEIIEEIIYVDGVEGEEDEEIIEEITETTVVETPDANSETLPFADSHVGPTTTVRKTTTRKISSTSAPDEITTVEETVVSGYTPEHEKSNIGFQVGIGKSGVNASVGNIGMGIGRSDEEFGKHGDVTIKLKKPEKKSNGKKGKKGTEEKGGPSVDASEERDVISKEKSKKPMALPNLKIFKRSTSQPTTPNIEEGIEESPLDVVSKKMGRSTSGLFKSEKSKSKSPEILEKPDVKIDVNAGQGRRMSTATTVEHSALIELDDDE